MLNQNNRSAPILDLMHIKLKHSKQKVPQFNMSDDCSGGLFDLFPLYPLVWYALNYGRSKSDFVA